MTKSRYSAVIVDDEKWTREVVKSLGAWEELDIDVVGEAADGAFGLEIIRRLLPDIILMDVRMPQMSGIDVLEILRREDNDAKVLMISGYDDYSYLRSALLLGASDYLLKPIKADELNAQLRRCVQELEKSERQGKDQDSMLSSGLLQMDWSADYLAVQNKLREALRGRNIRQIQEVFAGLEKLVAESSAQGIDKGILVGSYYTLENLLRSYIVDSGYTFSQIYQEKNCAFVFAGKISLKEMLGFLCGLFCAAAQEVEKLQKNRNRLDIEAIHRYVTAHCTQGITLEKTAERFYVSMEYLSKVFKSTYGEGFAEYTTRLRMEKAKELILGGCMPLKDVSSALGYSDQAHFYKTFKKYYQKTPGQYRQNLKNDNKEGKD